MHIKVNFKLKTFTYKMRFYILITNTSTSTTLDRILLDDYVFSFIYWWFSLCFVSFNVVPFDFVTCQVGYGSTYSNGCWNTLFFSRPFLGGAHVDFSIIIDGSNRTRYVNLLFFSSHSLSLFFVYIIMIKYGRDHCLNRRPDKKVSLFLWSHKHDRIESRAFLLESNLIWLVWSITPTRDHAACIGI